MSMVTRQFTNPSRGSPLLAGLPAVLGVLAPQGAWAAPRSGVVVLPGTATVVEQFAAEELRRGLHACGGWDVQIAAAPLAPDVLTFWVGSVETPSRFAALPALREVDHAEGLIEDGMCRQCDGSGIVLAGSGALNAAYTFIEQCVGFHWPEPGQEFEPPAAPLPLDRLDMEHGSYLRSARVRHLRARAAEGGVRRRADVRLESGFHSRQDAELANNTVTNYI